MRMAKLPDLVKGAGYIGTGVKPLDKPEDYLPKAYAADKALIEATKKGITSPAEVTKGFSPSFSSQFGLFMAAQPHQMWADELVKQINGVMADMGKNITLTSPLSSGFVPYDLVNPSRLIYPVYSPLRNKIPRVPGQGTSRRTKVVLGISGSQTGSSGGKFMDISIPEMVTGAGSLSNWPLNLPGSGTQDAEDINVPYQFFGLSESLSWLAQFSGQGFEDISALANLILLQEFMLNEEASMIAATSTALSAPAAPTVAVRAKGSTETALSVTTGNIYVRVTALNWYGETVASSAGSGALGSGDVADVTIAPVTGAMYYNLYVATGTADPGASASHVMASSVGGVKFTLQGTIPTSGNVPPTADTGTSASTREEGLLSVLSGHSAGHVYPASWEGGYVNQAVGAKLSASVLNTALQQLWNGAGAYRANPSELIAEGSDVMRLAEDLLTNNGQNAAYRLFIDQNQVNGITAGAAVSEFQNPITRSVVNILVHPWLTQGTAALMSYTLPFAWSNVNNVVEKVMVQDYLSISWPVIDASFRYSIFMYGAMVFNAPQYCGLLQGLQVADTTPYS